MEDYAILGDAIGERGTQLAGGHQVDVSPEEGLGIGDESRALPEAERMAPGGLDHQVQVRVRPKIGPGGGTERHQATEAVPASKGSQAPIAGDRDAIVETPQGRGVLVAVAGPVGKRAVNRPGKDAHPERSGAGSRVVEEPRAEGGLVQQLHGEVAVQRHDVGERGVEQSLVCRLGEPPDDQDGARLVGPGKLDRAVGARQHAEGFGRLDHREREAKRGLCPGIGGGHKTPIPVRDEPVVLQDA
jgi:hypothetical protein